MQDVRVAAVQMESAAGDKHANFAALERLAERAAAKGARIVAFSECCLTGYWFLRKLSVPELEAARRALGAPRRHARRGPRRGRGRGHLPQHLLFSNGIGVDDDEVRTGNAMVLDPYGRVLAETGKTGDDVVVADLDASLLDRATGRLWMKARRPDLYGELAVPTGRERDVHELKREE